MSRVIRTAVAAILLIAPGAGAQQWFATDSNLIAGMQWRAIGPLSSGRSTAVAGSSARPNEYYKGTTGGGVLKTTDGGRSWIPVTDKYFGGTIGAIAIQESNPDIVWVGGGESPIRGNVSHGEGVWKTTDGGQTWTYMGLKETQHISRIRINPTNPDIVYVGALGPVWGNSPARGVFRTKDGGKTWEKILSRPGNDSTGVSDLILDPSNPNIIYASLWEAWRRPWTLNSGGVGSGIFKSENGGDSWREISRNRGLPRGLMGNIGLAVSPAKPNRVWAIIENDSGGVYRSDDGGASWKFLNGNRNMLQRAWYYMRIYADPKDSNVVHVLNVSPYTSRDGGVTFGGGFGGGDNHDMWIDPQNGNRMIVVHDHGFNLRGDSGTVSTPLNTAQFYHVHLTNHVPYHVCGAQQDAGSVCVPNRGTGGIGGAGTQYGVAGGESGYIATNPKDPDESYGGNYGGNLQMQNRRTGESKRIDPWPLNPMGHPAEDLKYRFQWTYPIMASPHDPDVLYATSNVVHMTRDKGNKWEVISPDLTRADPKTLGNSGGPITKDQTSVEYYATVFAFAESPVQKGLLWAGSDDGLIHVSRDAGRNWRNVTPPDMKPFTRISIVEPSPHDAGTLYVAANRYQLLDFEPMLYRTSNFGESWTRIDAGINRTQFTRAIREDPLKKGMLYAATERGVWFSRNDGRNWESLQLNLPPVPVHDLAIKDNDLVAATHGRGFYVLDELTLLQQAQPEVMTRDAYLYAPKPTYRGLDNGVCVAYRVNRPNLPIAFEFVDANGNVVGTANAGGPPPAGAAAPGRGGGGGGGAGGGGAGGRGAGRGATAGTAPAAPPTPPGSCGEAGAVGGGGGGRGGGRGGGGGGSAAGSNAVGVNTVTWGMRYPNATTFSGMILWSGSTTGPLAAPGSYTVRMKAGDAPVQTQSFVIKADPRYGATDEDLVEQFNFHLKLRDKLSDANNGVRKIRNVKFQLEDRRGKIRGGGATEFRRLATALADSLSRVEEELYQVRNRSGQDPLNYPIKLNNQLAALIGFVAQGNKRPPAAAYDVYAVLEPQLMRELSRLESALSSAVPRINTLLRSAGLDEIAPATDELGAGGRGQGPGRGGGGGNGPGR